MQEALCASPQTGRRRDNPGDNPGRSLCPSCEAEECRMGRRREATAGEEVEARQTQADAPRKVVRWHEGDRSKAENGMHRGEKDEEEQEEGEGGDEGEYSGVGEEDGDGESGEGVEENEEEKEEGRARKEEGCRTEETRAMMQRGVEERQRDPEEETLLFSPCSLSDCSPVWREASEEREETEKDEEEESDPEFVILEDRSSTWSPTQADVLACARHLGFVFPGDFSFLSLARECLTAPLPAPWVACQSRRDGDIFFFNPDTKASVWENPVDTIFRAKLTAARLKHRGTAGETEGTCGGSQGASEAGTLSVRSGASPGLERRRMEVAAGEEESRAADPKGLAARDRETRKAGRGDDCVKKQKDEEEGSTEMKAKAHEQEEHAESEAAREQESQEKKERKEGEEGEEEGEEGEGEEGKGEQGEGEEGEEEEDELLNLLAPFEGVREEGEVTDGRLFPRPHFRGEGSREDVESREVERGREASNSESCAERKRSFFLFEEDSSEFEEGEAAAVPPCVPRFLLSDGGEKGASSSASSPSACRLEASPVSLLLSREVRTEKHGRLEEEKRLASAAKDLEWLSSPCVATKKTEDAETCSEPRIEGQGSGDGDTLCQERLDLSLENTEREQAEDTVSASVNGRKSQHSHNGNILDALLSTPSAALETRCWRAKRRRRSLGVRVTNTEAARVKYLGDKTASRPSSAVSLFSSSPGVASSSSHSSSSPSSSSSSSSSSPLSPSPCLAVSRSPPLSASASPSSCSPSNSSFFSPLFAPATPRAFAGSEEEDFLEQTAKGDAKSGSILASLSAFSPPAGLASPDAASSDSSPSLAASATPLLASPSKGATDEEPQEREIDLVQVFQVAGRARGTGGAAPGLPDGEMEAVELLEREPCGGVGSLSWSERRGENEDDERESEKPRGAGVSRDERQGIRLSDGSPSPPSAFSSSSRSGSPVSTSTGDGFWTFLRCMLSSSQVPLLTVASRVASRNVSVDNSQRTTPSQSPSFSPVASCTSSSSSASSSSSSSSLPSRSSPTDASSSAPSSFRLPSMATFPPSDASPATSSRLSPSSSPSWPSTSLCSAASASSSCVLSSFAPPRLACSAAAVAPSTRSSHDGGWEALERQEGERQQREVEQTEGGRGGTGEKDEEGKASEGSDESDGDGGREASEQREKENAEPHLNVQGGEASSQNRAVSEEDGEAAEEERDACDPHREHSDACKGGEGAHARGPEDKQATRVLEESGETGEDDGGATGTPLHTSRRLACSFQGEGPGVGIVSISQTPEREGRRGRGEATETTEISRSVDWRKDETSTFAEEAAEAAKRRITRNEAVYEREDESPSEKGEEKDSAKRRKERARHAGKGGSALHASCGDSKDANKEIKLSWAKTLKDSPPSDLASSAAWGVVEAPHLFVGCTDSPGAAAAQEGSHQNPAFRLPSASTCASLSSLPGSRECLQSEEEGVFSSVPGPPSLCGVGEKAKPAGTSRQAPHLDVGPREDKKNNPSNGSDEAARGADRADAGAREEPEEAEKAAVLVKEEAVEAEKVAAEEGFDDGGEREDEEAEGDGNEVDVRGGDEAGDDMNVKGEEEVAGDGGAGQSDEGRGNEVEAALREGGEVDFDAMKDGRTLDVAERCEEKWKLSSEDHAHPRARQMHAFAQKQLEERETLCRSPSSALFPLSPDLERPEWQKEATASVLSDLGSQQDERAVPGLERTCGDSQRMKRETEKEADASESLPPNCISSSIVAHDLATSSISSSSSFPFVCVSSSLPSASRSSCFTAETPAKLLHVKAAVRERERRISAQRRGETERRLEGEVRRAKRELAAALRLRREQEESHARQLSRLALQEAQLRREAQAAKTELARVLRRYTEREEETQPGEQEAEQEEEQEQGEEGEEDGQEEGELEEGEEGGEEGEQDRDQEEGGEEWKKGEETREGCGAAWSRVGRISGRGETCTGEQKTQGRGQKSFDERQKEERRKEADSRRERKTRHRGDPPPCGKAKTFRGLLLLAFDETDDSGKSEAGPGTAVCQKDLRLRDAEGQTPFPSATKGVGGVDTEKSGIEEVKSAWRQLAMQERLLLSWQRELEAHETKLQDVQRSLEKKDRCLRTRLLALQVETAEAARIRKAHETELHAIHVSLLERVADLKSTEALKQREAEGDAAHRKREQEMREEERRESERNAFEAKAEAKAKALAEGEEKLKEAFLQLVCRQRALEAQEAVFQEREEKQREAEAAMIALGQEVEAQRVRLAAEKGELDKRDRKMQEDVAEQMKLLREKEEAIQRAVEREARERELWTMQRVEERQKEREERETHLRERETWWKRHSDEVNAQLKKKEDECSRSAARIQKLREAIQGLFQIQHQKLVSSSSTEKDAGKREESRAMSSSFVFALLPASPLLLSPSAVQRHPRKQRSSDASGCGKTQAADAEGTEEEDDNEREERGALKNLKETLESLTGLALPSPRVAACLFRGSPDCSVRRKKASRQVRSSQTSLSPSRESPPRLSDRTNKQEEEAEPLDENDPSSSSKSEEDPTQKLKETASLFSFLAPAPRHLDASAAEQLLFLELEVLVLLLPFLEGRRKLLSAQRRLLRQGLILHNAAAKRAARDVGVTNAETKQQECGETRGSNLDKTSDEISQKISEERERLDVNLKAWNASARAVRFLLPLVARRLSALRERLRQPDALLSSTEFSEASRKLASAEPHSSNSPTPAESLATARLGLSKAKHMHETDGCPLSLSHTSSSCSPRRRAIFSSGDRISEGFPFPRQVTLLPPQETRVGSEGGRRRPAEPPTKTEGLTEQRGLSAVGLFSFRSLGGCCASVSLQHPHFLLPHSAYPSAGLLCDQGRNAFQGRGVPAAQAAGERFGRPSAKTREEESLFSPCSTRLPVGPKDAPSTRFSGVPAPPLSTVSGFPLFDATYWNYLWEGNSGRQRLGSLQPACRRSSSSPNGAASHTFSASRPQEGDISARPPVTPPPRRAVPDPVREDIDPPPSSSFSADKRASPSPLAFSLLPPGSYPFLLPQSCEQLHLRSCEAADPRIGSGAWPLLPCSFTGWAAVTDPLRDEEVFPKDSGSLSETPGGKNEDGQETQVPCLDRMRSSVVQKSRNSTHDRERLGHADLRRSGAHTLRGARELAPRGSAGVWREALHPGGVPGEALRSAEASLRRGEELNAKDRTEGKEATQTAGCAVGGVTYMSRRPVETRGTLRGDSQHPHSSVCDSGTRGKPRELPLSQLSLRAPLECRRRHHLPPNSARTVGSVGRSAAFSVCRERRALSARVHDPESEKRSLQFSECPPLACDTGDRSLEGQDFFGSLVRQREESTARRHAKGDADGDTRAERRQRPENMGASAQMHLASRVGFKVLPPLPPSTGREM
ncbi:UNVERIFIED_CONTAM: hypothetical protein HHA_314362 [Hammondia hammondi]|eukprot:XP_008883496.1 hypothetical protein HHA_314362 [Hammondia hammondi]